MIKISRFYRLKNSKVNVLQSIDLYTKENFLELNKILNNLGFRKKAKFF